MWTNYNSFRPLLHLTIYKSCGYSKLMKINIITGCWILLSYFNAGTACSSYFTAEDYLGPTHLEWELLTTTTVYTGCTLCIHSRSTDVSESQPAGEKTEITFWQSIWHEHSYKGVFETKRESIWLNRSSRIIWW